MPPEHLTVVIGADYPKEIEETVLALEIDAKENGMTGAGLRQLKKVPDEYRHVFRIKLGPDSAAKVKPLQVELCEGAKLSSCSKRSYVQKKRVSVMEGIRKLKNIGAVYKKTTAKWASAALEVPKTRKQKLRFTVYLRFINPKTDPL